jgi:uncharacterized membrane protein
MLLKDYRFFPNIKKQDVTFFRIFISISLVIIDISYEKNSMIPSLITAETSKSFDTLISSTMKVFSVFKTICFRKIKKSK